MILPQFGRHRRHRRRLGSGNEDQFTTKTQRHQEDRDDERVVRAVALPDFFSVLVSSWFNSFRGARPGERPNRASQALLAVLSGKGTVQRKADDKGMLELCGVLTKLIGITESPFDFAALDEKWVALYDARDTA